MRPATAGMGRAATGVLAAISLAAACARTPSIRDASEATHQYVQATGTIVAIDAPSRLVVLQSGDGVFSVQAGPQVGNFGRLRVGDDVVVDHTRSVVIDLQEADAGEPGAYLMEGATQAAAGDAPHAAATQVVTVLAPILAIDAQACTVTVQGPRGHRWALEVRKPEYREQLHRLKVGHLLRVRFTEAVAVGIRAGR